jgi:hypothetical protein
MRRSTREERKPVTRNDDDNNNNNSHKIIHLRKGGTQDNVSRSYS